MAAVFGLYRLQAGNAPRKNGMSSRNMTIRRLFQTAINIILLPISLVIAGFLLLAFLVIYPPVLCASLLGYRRWYRTLRIAGRTQSPSALLRSHQCGTLIVNYPSLGWNTSHCWWTPDEVESLSPIPIPTDDDRNNRIKSKNDGKLSHPFDRWGYERYLALETGTAILLSTRRGHKIAAKLHSQSPTYKVVTSWSGPCEFELDQ